jgi:Fe-S cluster assembly ATPase SufC
VIAGNPKYDVVGGDILIETGIKGQERLVSLLDMAPDERSKAGIFLSFQNVPEIK